MTVHDAIPKRKRLNGQLPHSTKLRQKWRGFCFLALLELPDGFIGQVRRHPPPDKNAGTMRKAGLSLTPTLSHKVRYFIFTQLIIYFNAFLLIIFSEL